MLGVAFRGFQNRHASLILRSGVLSPGDEIFFLSGKVTDNPTQTSVWDKARQVHVEDPLVKFMNHSCTPNTIIHDSRVTALQIIEAGEDLTFNYLQNEPEITSGFTCDTCGGMILGRLYPPSCCIHP